ncbi:MAG: response regulator, partial [candidate division Zixibacteria bacterium]|nr:response regulator [candidate division Zixibacteria bacterium]
MPGMSGLEVANRVKKLDPDVPVVLVTGWEVAIEPAQLEAAGVSGLLHKPFRIEQLTDIINSAASRQSAS